MGAQTGITSDVDEHPLHEALIRPILFAGAVPEIVLLEVTTVFALFVLVGVHIATTVVAVVYATVVHSLAVWLTAQDPQIIAVYVRSIWTKDFYAPHASPLQSSPTVYPAIPGRR